MHVIVDKANDFSNPKIVFKKAKEYLGKDVIIRPPTSF
jgi:hypothetical protein